MKHIIAILLENEAGALSRVVGLFSARGYNIESLAVAPTESPQISRLTVVVSGEEATEKITKQLHRLIDVLKVMELTEHSCLERELMLIKLRSDGRDSEEIKNLSDIFRGRIIDVREKTCVVELTGNTSKLDAFVDAIRSIGRVSVLEVVRTGCVGMVRGNRILGV